MGLLDGIRARHPDLRAEYPGDTPDADGFGRLFGHRDEFSPPAYGDYIATSNDIYSIVTFRTRHMGSLDLQAFTGRGTEKEEVTDGPFVELVRDVNPHWTWRRLMRMTELCMGLWGEAFWAVEKDRAGRPAELWWLKSPRVHPVPDSSGYLSGFTYDPADGGQPIPFDADEMIWFRYPNPLDEFAGLSPLAAARLAADTGKAMTESNRNLFTNGMQTGGLIAPPKDLTFSTEQAEELEDDLQRRLQGVDKAHRWAVLRFEAQQLDLGVTPKDAEFLGGLNATFRQACRAYGVPSPLLYDMEHATLANLRELHLSLWQDTLVPDAKFYAADIEEQLLPMFPGRPDHVEWDFSRVPVLQDALTASWARERQQIEAGGLTINEWRKSKGMPPVEWGDVWWAPVNKAPVSTPDDAPSDEDRTEALLRRLLDDGPPDEAPVDTNPYAAPNGQT